MKYKETEIAVFNFLNKKFQENNSFTFSVRKKATKGAETNYFLGTENGKYFAFTQWHIPSAYKGASRDLISYKIDLKNNSCLLSLSYRMSKTPHDKQNEYNLELGTYLKKHWGVIGISRETSETTNHHDLIIKYKDSINSILSLEKALDEFISQSHELTNKAINELKAIRPNWDAGKISLKEFDSNIKKMNDRLSKHGGNTVAVSKKETKIQKELNIPLNRILFGPPGTGKTYQTRKLAYEIIKNEKLENSKEDFEKALDLFKDLKGDQIEFITFHQNYSYEDFVQGLRPDVEAGEMRFKKHNGVFFKIAKLAKESYLKSKNKPQDIEISFEDAFNSLNKDIFEEEKEVEIRMRAKGYKFSITDISETHIHFRKQSGGTSHNLVISTVKAIYDRMMEYPETGLGSYYHPLNTALKEEAKKLKAQVKQEPLKNYVLIIDEINRANISRVFGELITLLEPNKRFGKTEELEIQLPSGDRFVVPPNLYLIGTMNTADKSIALLDIALRRRFEFVPIFPDKGLVVPDYRNLFDKLNNEIASLKSPDFTIGHSYFMANENGKIDLKEVMDNKVIPLLCEYFMNDLRQVKKLLKKIGVEIKEEHYGILRFNGLKSGKINDETVN
jgi:hypothetical protein